MRHLALIAVVLAIPLPARAQFRNRPGVDHLNRHLAGHVVDFTHNNGRDGRIYSPILGMPRDLYIYLPPGYTPASAYPMIVYLHMGYVDEHTITGSRRLIELDRMILRGEFPPVVVACPDGTFSGENQVRGHHSMFINGQGGRFADHIMQEVVPFVMRGYSIRPERQAHALLGVSAGGFGALNLAITHRDFFSAVATLAAPANLRYDNVDGDYRENFNPATYRWKTQYDPDEVVGVFRFGLSRSRASKYMEPVFGDDPGVEDRIARENPADLIFSTNLQPGELAIYLNYGGRDNWNFDAQAESFAWLASQRGIAVTLDRDPKGKHNLAYFRTNHVRAYCWLRGNLTRKD